MQTIYKILCEVRLLHEFYLTKADGSSIFGLTAAADRDSFLQDYSNRVQRSINSDVDYIIPPIAQPLFKNYRLRLLRTYSGFKIAIEVTQTVSGTKTTYTPVAPLPAGLNIPVLLTRTNADFDSYTNGRLNNAFNSLYYISNGNTTGVKTFPFLSNAIPAQSATASYEQGELSISGNAANAFYFDSTGVAKFAPITGKNFLSEADRNLVTTSFSYSFLPTDKVTNAVMTLTDSNNKTIYTRTTKGSTVLQSLPFSVDESLVNTVPATVTEDTYLYTLTVTGNKGYNKTYKLIFLDDDLSTFNPWGMVNIIPQPANAAFNCVDAKGLLMATTPVFEIWIKSRMSFWRYINDQGLLLKAVNPSFLQLTGNDLVSLTPLPATYAPIQKLPNPKRFYPVKPEGQQIFADIIVPTSDIFPLGP